MGGGGGLIIGVLCFKKIMVRLTFGRDFSFVYENEGKGVGTTWRN